jgi:small subunit ribosomal protein S1
MSTDLQPPHNTPSPPPPPVDEGYWAALLQEDDAVKRGIGSERNTDVWGDFAITAEAPPFSDVIDSAEFQQDWETAERYLDTDEKTELEVTGYNRGGLLVTWNSLRGFVPASQLVDFPVDVDEITRQESLAERVGKRLSLRIIELDRMQNRLILSERAAQVESGQRADVLDNLQPGQTCAGTVTNLCDFGAFVDLGGIEGLIHISEISWGRIGHPRDVLIGGQGVQVYVINVDKEQGRVALSLKRLQPDPWQAVETRYEIGQWVEGVITNVVDFGAFACVEEGLEGLIHVSELAEGQFLHPRNVVDEGETVRARILNIDSNARRLGLSLRNSSESGNGNVEVSAD